MRAGEEKGFAVARGSKIAHTVSIETIEYGLAWGVARRVRSGRLGNAEGLMRRLRRVIPALRGEGLERRNHCEFRATAEAFTDVMELDHHRHRDHPADRSDGDLRGGE